MTVAILDPEYASSDYPYVVEYQAPKTMEQVGYRTYEREFVVEASYPEVFQNLKVARTFCLDGREHVHRLDFEKTGEGLNWILVRDRLINIVSGG